MLVDTSLSMAGYIADRIPAMQRRMIEALETIPGVSSVGFINQIPLGGGGSTEDVFADQTTELKPANAAANVAIFSISPEYFHAAQTTLLPAALSPGMTTQNQPRVAVVNRLVCAQALRLRGKRDGKILQAARRASASR